MGGEISFYIFMLGGVGPGLVEVGVGDGVGVLLYGGGVWLVD